MPALRNGKRENFCRRYVAHHDGSRAAREAGYKGERLHTKAYALMAEPDIAARIVELDRAQLRDLDITATNTKRELARIAFADPRRLFNEDGAMIHPQHWPEDFAAAVASVKAKIEERDVPEPTADDPKRTVKVRTITTEVKFWDKTRALALLAEHFKLIGHDADAAARAHTDMAQRMLKARARLIERGHALHLVHDATVTSQASA